MVAEISKKILVSLVIIIFVVWVLTQLFTDPVGSAHFVGDVFGAIGDAIGAIRDFVSALGD